MSGQSFLETRGLVKEYRNRRVVDQVNLQVLSGSVVGLLGPNGAGKTTTFYSIASTELFTHGLFADDTMLRQIKAAFAAPERIPADGVTDPDPPAPDR